MTIGVISLVIALYLAGWRSARPWLTQLATAITVGYVTVALIFISTSSHDFFSNMELAPDNNSDTKRLMLAASAGLLAQFIIWLNRLAHTSSVGSRWFAMYADAAIGALCGVAGLALAAAVRPVEIRVLTQSQAAAFGFAGGAVALGLITLARKLLPFSDGAPGAADAGGTCMYAGQAYSDGATISMPGNALPVVKVCDGKTGCWKVEPADAARELASLGLR